MKRTTYHIQSNTTAQPAPTPAPSSRPTSALGERIRAALYSGLAVCLALFLILPGGYAAIVHKPHLPIVTGLAAASVVLSLLFSCYLVVSWSIQTASRDWRVDHQERIRRWKLEDEDRDLAWAQLAHDTEQPQETTPDLSWIHGLALKLLERHYKGQKITRAACTKANLCTQPEWNLINQIWKAIGFKRDNSLALPDTLEIAWARWNQQVVVDHTTINCKRRPSPRAPIARFDIDPDTLTERPKVL